jgi:hypothetical protein
LSALHILGAKQLAAGMPAVESVAAFHGNFRGRWRANPEILDSQFIHTNTNFLSPIQMHLRIVQCIHVVYKAGVYILQVESLLQFRVKQRGLFASTRKRKKQAGAL